MIGPLKRKEMGAVIIAKLGGKSRSEEMGGYRQEAKKEAFLDFAVSLKEMNYQKGLEALTYLIELCSEQEEPDEYGHKLDMY